MRRFEGSRLTQVILLSTVDDIHLWAEAIRLGAYDFLPKPIDPDQLKWILQGAFAKKLTRILSAQPFAPH